MSHAARPTGSVFGRTVFRRRIFTALSLVALASAAVAGVALANAADPVSTAAHVRVGAIHVVNGVQVVRISISGRWQWPTQTSDCNDARTGVGYAVDWSDPNQTGNHVTILNSDSVDVGAETGNAYNDP